MHYYKLRINQFKIHKRGRLFVEANMLPRYLEYSSKMNTDILRFMYLARDCQSQRERKLEGTCVPWRQILICACTFRLKI